MSGWAMASLVKPIMLVSGVLSSWLMLAMNCDFTEAAASASARAERFLHRLARADVAQHVRRPDDGAGVRADFQRRLALEPDLPTILVDHAVLDLHRAGALAGGRIEDRRDGAIPVVGMHQAGHGL